MARFINLADLVDQTNDSKSNTDTYFLDLEAFAADLYLDENQVKPGSIEIQEMALQGVFPLEEKHKVWRTREDKDKKNPVLA